jgi:hypothetical protein
LEELFRDSWLYRGTSLIKNSAPVGPHSRTMPRALWRSYGGGLFLMSEVTLHRFSVWELLRVGVGGCSELRAQG